MSKCLNWLKLFNLPQDSSEYKTWRCRFLWRRLGWVLWVALFVLSISTALDLYRAFFLVETGKITIEEVNLFLIENLIQAGNLIICTILHRRWGRTNPAKLLTFFCLLTTLAPQIIATLQGFGRSDFTGWILTYVGVAVLVPVYWWLHLLLQLSVIVYFLGINYALNINTTIDGEPLYSLGLLLFLLILYFICDLAVYLRESLQRTEFESRRELQMFLHAIAHDLRTPLLGTSIVLQNLLNKSDSVVSVDRSVLNCLLESNSRQLNLVSLLLEAYDSQVRNLELQSQPLQICVLLASVLSDLEPLLKQKNIIIKNLVKTDLPLIDADTTQLQRVYSNLIANAIEHNPYGITLTLDAQVQGKMLLCKVQDNGVGISKKQCESIFELFSRGKSARLMPGLGLGLYLSRRIVQAHGGQMGVISSQGDGATFWFTLPIVEDNKQGGKC